VSALATALIVFLCVAGGAIFGVFLRSAVPRHLSPDAKDVARLGTGLIGTIAALVLGLLIASAKSSFDTRSGQINRVTADFIVLDNLLAKYGPEANPARESLRHALTIMTERIWGEAKAHPEKRIAYAPSDTLEEFHERLQGLSGDNEAQRSLKRRAIAAETDLAKTRVLLFAEAETDQSIPWPFLTVLTFWLTLIFISFSLFAQPNPIVIACLLLFALSAAAAIYLVLELAQPFDGLMQISREPLRNALAPLRH
jgi:hypothetical protein